MKYRTNCETSYPTEYIFFLFLFRFIKQRPLRVIEAVLVGLISSVIAFNLIYFKEDCVTLGSPNITHKLQVSMLLNIIVFDPSKIQYISYTDAVLLPLSPS